MGVSPLNFITLSVTLFFNLFLTSIVFDNFILMYSQLFIYFFNVVVSFSFIFEFFFLIVFLYIYMNLFSFLINTLYRYSVNTHNNPAPVASLKKLVFSSNSNLLLKSFLLRGIV